MAQELVLGWLRDIASNGERFRELEAQGQGAHWAEWVRESIEKSIVGLEEARKDTEGRRGLVIQSIAEFESLISKDKSFFSEYLGRIQEVLKKTGDDRKIALAGLIASLLLQEGSIKIALSSVNQKALRSSVLVFARGAEAESNWPSRGNAKEGQLCLCVISRNEGNGPMPIGEAQQERTASNEKTTGCATPVYRTHPSCDKSPGSGCPCSQF
jgi:hypothetical protein